MHACRYKRGYYLPYVQYKEEILSRSPYVSVFYDVVSNQEIDALTGFVKGTVAGTFHLAAMTASGVAAGLYQAVRGMEQRG